MARAAPFSAVQRLLVTVVCAAAWCRASEMRHGTVRYERVEGNAVRFHIRMQWRRTDAFRGTSDDDHRAKTGDVVEVMGAAGAAGGPVTFTTGDGREYRVKMTVTDYSAHPLDEYVYGLAKIVHAYPSESNGRRPWVAVLRGCCRPGDGSEFRLTTYVDLVMSPQSLSVKALPVIVVPAGNVTVVDLPANTAGGQPGRYWRMAQGAELGGLAAHDSSYLFFNLTDYLTGRLTVNADCGATPNCLLPAGADIPFSVMVAGWMGKAFVPSEMRLKVVSQQEWAKRPVFFGKAAAATELQGVVGYEMFFTLEAMSRDVRMDANGVAQRGCLQAIRVLNMPDGALLSHPLASAPTCVNRTLDFRWTPSEAEAGRHSVCYDAVDDSRRQSSQKCVTLVVAAAPQSAMPQFTSPATDNEVVEYYMRQKKTLTITAESSNAYDVLAIELADPSILGKYGMTLSNTRNVQGRLRATDTASSAIVSADFGWWPHISHGALTAPVCFNLKKYEDPGRSGSTTVLVKQRCITVSVPRCRYLAGPDDDIKKIADIFKVDWLTLWGLNSNLPSLATPPGKQIMVGRLYQVMEGDSVLSIATQFQTTVSSIRGLNYDMSDGRAANFLVPNSAICIFPELCP